MATEYEQLEVLIMDLGGFVGTSQWYHRENKNSVYTDGFKEFMIRAKSNWLYDDIIQWEVFEALKSRNKPDSYYFSVEVSNDCTCVMTLKDYRNKQLYQRRLGYTDLPKGKALFTCGWDGKHLITCLMSEN
jgi:hypothetical protein